MGNPLLTLAGGNSPQIPQQIQQLVNAYKMGANPAQYFQAVLQQNPQMASVLQNIRGGGDMRQVFYSLCQQRGIEPNKILNYFK